ncbi:BrnA antitoxin family protein [Pararhizobium arenae]|uniref:BrnA antitoxin family protein n=1 Tax=Pararhizobium arenae TaxID=1856850 RepID=UPI00094B0A8C|nr:BrnA antitoxin family protein [Pararhizobium arenae]
MTNAKRSKISSVQANSSETSDHEMELPHPDDEEWTAEEMRVARPFSEVFPELMQSLRKSRGRPVAERRKQQISIRLDTDVVEKFKATGKGWQARMNDALRKATADL